MTGRASDSNEGTSTTYLPTTGAPCSTSPAVYTGLTPYPTRVLLVLCQQQFTAARTRRAVPTLDRIERRPSNMTTSNPQRSAVALSRTSSVHKPVAAWGGSCRARRTRRMQVLLPTPGCPVRKMCCLRMQPMNYSRQPCLEPLCLQKQLAFLCRRPAVLWCEHCVAVCLGYVGV